MNQAKKNYSKYCCFAKKKKKIQQILLLWNPLYQGREHKNLDSFFFQKKGIELLTGLDSF